MVPFALSCHTFFYSEGNNSGESLFYRGSLLNNSYYARIRLIPTFSLSLASGPLMIAGPLSGIRTPPPYGTATEKSSSLSANYLNSYIFTPCIDHAKSLHYRIVRILFTILAVLSMPLG